MPRELSRLVAANRILAHEGVVDAFGHVSVRDPRNRERFWLSRSRSPALVELDDLMEFALDGAAIDARGRTPYGERMIHAAVYAARADVHSVVHHHAYGVLPFTITGEPLRPVVHTASVIGAEIPVWDIRTRFGGTDMLVRSIEQGRDLAATLADNTCVLIRGHGAVVVGASVERAVLTAIYLQVNANVLLQALPLGSARAALGRGDRALGRSAVLAARARSELGVLLPARRRRPRLGRRLQVPSDRRAAIGGFRIAGGGGHGRAHTHSNNNLGGIDENHEARSHTARSGGARRFGRRATAATTRGESAAAAADEFLRDERRQGRRRQSRRLGRRRRALPERSRGRRPRQRHVARVPERGRARRELASTHARDRIGRGPWFNARGALIASNVDDLHQDRNNIRKPTALNEKGEEVNGVGNQPNMHDMLTGSDSTGRLVPGNVTLTTCNNWTSNSAGNAMLGHHDRLGGPNASWNAVHSSRSCSQEDLVATGGAGLFYCFVAQ